MPGAAGVVRGEGRMATEGDAAVDITVIETCKENVQPLKRGRKAQELVCDLQERESHGANPLALRENLDTQLRY